MCCDCISVLVLSFVFFFKQKTAYEMRISDWSSDVCSSDLQIAIGARSARGAALDFHLAAKLDHTVGGQLEELHRAFRVAQHPGAQLFAPYSHARSRGGKQRLPRKEEAGVHHLELRTADIIAGERRRPIGVLPEAIAQEQKQKSD